MPDERAKVPGPARKGIFSRRPRKAHDQPSSISEDHGNVHLKGPDHVDVTLTPTAAFETARRVETKAIDLLVKQITRKHRP